MGLSLAARRARLQAVQAAIDAGGGGALQLFDGSMPAAPEQAAPGAPLAIIALASPSWALHATEAQLLLQPAQGNAAASGQPTWARFVSGAGAAVFDCTAGPPLSGAALIVSNGQAPPNAQLFIGGEISVSGTLIEP